jgi:hypothetical protein
VILNGSKIDAEDPWGPGIFDKLVPFPGLRTCATIRRTIWRFTTLKLAHMLYDLRVESEGTLQVT